MINPGTNQGGWNGENAIRAHQIETQMHEQKPQGDSHHLINHAQVKPEHDKKNSEKVADIKTDHKTRVL